MVTLFKGVTRVTVFDRIRRCRSRMRCGQRNNGKGRHIRNVLWILFSDIGKAT
jgi:hypothetical protein